MVPELPGRGDGCGLLGRRRPWRSLQQVAASDDPFDEWLKERGREFYHFEPSQTLVEHEEVFEAEVT